ncbi:MAG: prepilin-type N-terminal cleavage/methylation domain-containing protein [Betaproteobacteria bacterium]|nr:prepilin-type N-terminal cleavage/methylation domain-containing protein [Betaproteobacteria bacterium]
MKSGQRGFTLAEIAIVLIIVGLLLGGIFKGQELITQAKIRNIGNEFNNISAAIALYQDRYKALPGDDARAGRWKIGGASLTPPAEAGNGRIEGAWNSSRNTDETRLFWAELRLSGFIMGETETLEGASALPVHPMGGVFGVEQNNALGLGGGLMLCANRLPAKIAQALDTQLDNGDARTGALRAIPETEAATLPVSAPTTDYDESSDALYTVCRRI